MATASQFGRIESVGLPCSAFYPNDGSLWRRDFRQQMSQSEARVGITAGVPQIADRLEISIAVDDRSRWITRPPAAFAAG